MAIPKEPRQLMITIMYLVLTALLALNVSAEIFNAFKLVNKGLQKSNEVLDRQNKRVPDQVKTLAQKDPERYGEYAERVDDVVKTGDEFVTYVETIWDSLLHKSGGTIQKNGKEVMKNKKNKDATTRYLVDQGKGEQLKSKIIAAREDFLNYIEPEEREAFKSKIALEVDDKSWKEAKKKASWADFNFRQMPVGAVQPILTKFINDAKATESAVLNHYLEKVGGTDVVFDKFEVVSAPEKSYIVTGDTYKSKIFLGAASDNVDELNVSVNGRSLSVENGVAEYTASASSTGIKKYTARISFKNPVTGEPTDVERQFEYEVGERSVSVSADKMNVFYIGVDNPVTISAAGVSSNKLNVTTGSGITIKSTGGSSYVVTANTPGKSSVNVSGGGLPSTSKEFRVKRIPDPVPKLSGERGGGIPNGVFRAQLGLIADLEDFDFEARCEIIGFQLVRVARRQDPEPASNSGGRFNDAAQRLVNKAAPGDRYFFEDIKAKCPGDKIGRDVGSMTFLIR